MLIDAVTRNGRAERAGLSANDGIVSVDGRRVEAPSDLWNALARQGGAYRVEIGVFRGGGLLSVTLPTAAASAVGGFPGPPRPDLRPGGVLVCPSCGTRVTHQWGLPYYSVQCPSCGTMMIRAQ